ncbi:hypothetical protein GE061_010107 [Apolygus lucorum]|uniref:C2H2-type domain-containing protein n=1 Tax=Apolygus lucorum TaxID=248454 RepID=A0A8S9Y698_APOLU|nr:hypothetical protein GE061_010107 [Apolygus lucorum]
MTADSDKNQANIVCLICNASIGVSTRNNCPIFHFNVTSSEQPVANILSVVLGQEVRKEFVHSEIICKKCYKLCNEVDELQERLTEIKMELNNYYQKTLRKLEGIDDEEAEAPAPPPIVPKPPPSTPVVKRGPGRPRKNRPEESVETSRPKEVGSDDEDDAEIVGVTDDDEIVEDDFIGVGIDDENDEDYIPENRQKGEGARKDAASKSDIQIKMEVIDEEEEDELDESVGKPQVARRKSTGKKAEAVNIIPQMIISRSNKTYTCLICSAEEKVQGDARTLINHMKAEHNIRLYICDMCEQEMSAHFDEHVANEEGEFSCETCGRVFTNLRLYRVHKRMHMPQHKNHVCEQCGKAFLSKNMLDEHMNIHTGARPYKCNECGKEFASKYSAKAHEKIHVERPRPYKCSQCSKAFITEANLLQHERTHNATKSFPCQVCGKSFSSGRNLEVHCVIHTGYKPFVCRVCGKAFARKAEIRDHERTHTGEKPYQCEFCGATFGQRSNLQSHKRATHYDDKRYQCIECGKAFKRRRLLDYHIKAAHTGERPYKCQICSATFIYPEHFKKHRRIHTGEKPYLCEVCGKAFNSRDNRNAHRFVHSDKKPYECLVCGVGFMRKPQLYNHMQTQGHINDTIVVNQPRLTTEDELISQETEAQMEMIITDNQEKWDTEQVMDEAGELIAAQEGEGDTKMYIRELKEHVIIQGKEEHIDETQYSEEVGHLIIDGQVQFADGETLELDAGTTIGESIEGTPIVVPAGHTGEFTVEAGEGTTVETPNGPVRLVHISLPESADPNHQGTWFNIVQQ